MTTRNETVPTGAPRAFTGSRAMLRADRAEQHRGRAISSGQPAERFLEAYRAARCAAGAVVQPGLRRRGHTDVWHLLPVEVPELAPWAEAFRGYAPLAAAVEDGLPREIPQQLADDFLWAVGRFLDIVDEQLGVLGPAA